MPYLPIIKDSKFLEYGADIGAIVVHASHILWRPSLLPAVQAEHEVIIDIETNRCVTTDAHKSTNYKDLPYCLNETELPQIMADSTFRLQRLVEPAVQFQVDNGSAIVMAPYLMFGDWRSRTFSVNLELVADVINHAEGQSHGKPLYAVINLSSDILKSVDGTSYVKDRYLEFSDHVEGYVIIPDSLTDDKADVGTLMNLARLVHGLKTAGKKVLVFPIGGFGLVLQAVGATHYGSGIFGKESSSVAMFDSEGNGFSRQDRWIYDPHIYEYVNAVALANAGHTCSCTACDGGVAGTLALKKQHDALVRNELGKALMSLPEDQRLPFMHDQLEAAARRVRAYERDDFGPKNSQYLERWLAVVEAAMSWPATVEEDDGLLDDLLKEIDEEA